MSRAARIGRMLAEGRVALPGDHRRLPAGACRALEGRYAPRFRPHDLLPAAPLLTSDAFRKHDHCRQVLLLPTHRPRHESDEKACLAYLLTLGLNLIRYFFSRERGESGLRCYLARSAERSPDPAPSDKNRLPLTRLPGESSSMAREHGLRDQMRYMAGKTTECTLVSPQLPWLSRAAAALALALR